MTEEIIQQQSLSEKSFSLFKRDIFLFFTNLVTGVIIARMMGPAVLGLWIILQMIPAYAEGFGRVKFDIAAVYFLGKKKYHVGDVVFTLNFIAILTSGVIIGLFLANLDWCYRLLFGNSSADVHLFIYFMLLQIPLQFLYLNYSYLLLYREDVKNYNRMVVIKALVSSGLSIVLLVIFRWGLLAVIIPSLLSMLLGLLYGVITFGRVKRNGPLFNLPLVKDLFSYGSKIYAATLISSLNSYVTNLIVVFYLVPAKVAFFNMALNKGVLMNKIPDAMNTILFPRVSKTDNDGVSAKLIARAFRVALLILLLLGALAFVAIKPIVYILYGRDYLPMVVPFWLLLPGLIISSAASVLSQYFAGVGRVDLSVKIPIIPFLVQVVVAMLMIPPFGIAGAAVSFLVAMFCLALIQIAVFLHISNCTLKGDLMIQGEDVLTVKVFIINQLARIKTGVLQNFVIIKEKMFGA